MKAIRFNFIDFLICLFFTLLTLVFLLLSTEDIKHGVISEFRNPDTYIRIKTFPFDKAYSDNVSVGQNVINYKNGCTLGNIINISFYDAPNDADAQKGYVYAVIEIDSEAKFEDGHFMIENEKILINEIKEFAVPTLFFQGDIVSILNSSNKLSFAG